MSNLRRFLLGAGGFVGIVSLVISAWSAISNYHYRHIEQTINLLDLSNDKFARRIGAIVSLEYLTKDIRIPFCPFRFCLIREAEVFPNIDLFFENEELFNKALKPLIEKDFSTSRIRGGDMRRFTIRKSNLSNIFWTNVDLRKSEFGGNNLRCAQFSNVKFLDSIFRNSDFSGGQVHNSDFSDAKFYDNDMSGMRFIDVNISNARFVWTKGKPMMDPDTLKGAWAFEGQEPQFLVGEFNAPYQQAEELKTYSVCPPASASAESGPYTTMPCPRNYQSQKILSNVETKSWEKWCAARPSWYAKLPTQFKSLFK